MAQILKLGPYPFSHTTDKWQFHYFKGGSLQGETEDFSIYAFIQIGSKSLELYQYN